VSVDRLRSVVDASVKQVILDIYFAGQSVTNGEMRRNALGEPINEESARRSRALGVRDMHVAVMNAMKSNMTLPESVLKEVQQVEEKYLEEAKGFYHEIETAVGIRFEW